MLKLRGGVVVSTEPLEVEVDGEVRAAWSDAGLIGPLERGDDVLVNTEALDLGLGSGGFDVVHANLTRGLRGPGSSREHVIKLNYTSLQHPVEPVELPDGEIEQAPASMPVLVCHLHGHLAPAAWAASCARPGLRVGYVQTPGGSLPGALSRDVRDLRDRGLLVDHVTAGACYGGEHEAISVIGALDAGARGLGWDAAIAAPGPGILGSATRFGHGGMAALDNAHAALAAGLPTLLCPRLSSSDPRPRHRGLSHHTATVLRLLLREVSVAVPELDGEPLAGSFAESDAEGGSPADALDALAAVTEGRHRRVLEAIDLPGYAESGLPTRTMGRALGEDPLFFAAALAAGAALARTAGDEDGEGP